MNFKIKQIVKIIMQNVVFPVVYQVGKLRRVDRRLVVFADSHHNEVPYSMEDLYAWFAGKDYTVLAMTRDCDRSGYFGGLCFMLKFMLVYARAGYVFICDNFLPVASCKKREKTVVVQMWHAGGMLKKYAYDTPRDIPKYYKGNVFRNYSLVLTSDDACDRAYVSGMRVDPSIVKGLGLSRTDRFFRQEYLEACRAQFLKQYPNAEGKKVVLWAPTFRGNAATPEIVDMAFLERLREALGEDWLVITKLHPHLQKHVGEDDCRIPTEQLLPVTDVLISDYSSVIYDFLLLERPIVFYAPDLDYYVKEEQFYIDYSEMPGPIVTGEAELAEAVKAAFVNPETDRIRAFRQTYMGACDGHALERLVNELQL
ncbi:MAG: CDP-glycerol glycerophosphotransferase family protein [bacterium]|nr:CDP-glycerol glycerophosphotransferase family protein [bacterium]MDY4099842.1 CDP-glycerol glycerophosphotransferase family protein [Lachnospiraceae bacterium]